MESGGLLGLMFEFLQIKQLKKVKVVAGWPLKEDVVTFNKTIYDEQRPEQLEK